MRLFFTNFTLQWTLTVFILKLFFWLLPSPIFTHPQLTHLLSFTSLLIHSPFPHSLSLLLQMLFLFTLFPHSTPPVTHSSSFTSSLTHPSYLLILHSPPPPYPLTHSPSSPQSLSIYSPFPSTHSLFLHLHTLLFPILLSLIQLTFINRICPTHCNLCPNNKSFKFLLLQTFQKFTVY